jgi:hypothetical protein
MNFSKQFWITFVVVLCVSAGLAWLAGYNFDQRGPWVAYVALVGIAVAFIAGIFAELP